MACSFLFDSQIVMPGPVPGINVFLANPVKTWMAGLNPAMTMFFRHCEELLRRSNPVLCCPWIASLRSQ
jgi:hypothetical protein